MTKLDPSSPRGHELEHLTQQSYFRQRFFDQLEHLGDTAADAQRYDEAISHYTTALSLTPPSSQDLLIKRGKAYMKVGSWQLSLDDANQVLHSRLSAANLIDAYLQVIKLDPSSPWGMR